MKRMLSVLILLLSACAALAGLWRRDSPGAALHGLVLMAIAAMGTWLIILERRIRQARLQLRLAGNGARDGASGDGASGELPVLARPEPATLHLLDQLSSGIVVHGPDGSIRYANPKAAALLGVDPAAVPGQALAAPEGGFVREDGTPMPQAEQPAWRVLASGAPVHELVVGVQRPGGLRRAWLLVNAYPEFAPGGELSQVVVNFVDITRRKQAESATLASEERFRLAIHAAPFPIMIHAEDGEVLTVNETWTALTGYRLEDIPTISEWTRRAYGERREAVKAYIDGLYGGPGRVEEGEYPVTAASGAVLRWAFGSAPLGLMADGRRAVISMAKDVTEEKRAEAERLELAGKLVQAQNLDSLGSLAGGVAHDMNNVLGAILSLVSTLREQAAPGDPRTDALDTILKACLRGRGVVKGLLSFAQKDLQEERWLDLNALVRETAPRLNDFPQRDIRLSLELEEGLGRVWGDAGALGRALLDLCLNALDAMPQGGRLRIQTRSLAAGGVELRVEDTGTGMEPEVLAKAMEPFFTTKPTGKGTGLGLATVFGTLRAHGGRFDLHSRPGIGTEAVLVLPVARVESAGAAAASAPLPAPVAAAGSPLDILLVDDDQLLRGCVALMLGAMGHRVVEAGGGREALAILERGLAADLVILDMKMPEMSGAEALPRLRGLRPDLPVLIATGYSEDDLATLLLDHPRVHSLHKPFTMGEIAEKIAALGVQARALPLVSR